MAEDIGFGRLPRGAKILWERVDRGQTLSLGFFFATGSRFDPPGLSGTAHLVEHLLFKGTRDHTAASLARLVDRVGGDLNAWTDREEMAFTCTVPADSWRVAVEALVQICFFPTFPESEFLREKEVIRNEILSTLEDPEELSYEAYLQSICPGDWSRPVAGTEKSLEGISLDAAKRWWTEFGTLPRLTVAFSGSGDPLVLSAEVARQLDDLPAGVPRDERAPARFLPLQKRWVQKAPFQMVQILGGFTIEPPRTAREAMVWQIFSMLWGETMSSRLFQAIREDRGLCYSVTSQLFDSDGNWGLQFFAACAPENAGPLLEALAVEISRLASDPPSASEWDDGRAALRGGIILGAERAESRVGRLWRQHESFGVLLGAEATQETLSSPVTREEADLVLRQLVSIPPSLLVWGKLPKGWSLPESWIP